MLGNIILIVVCLFFAAFFAAAETAFNFANRNHLEDKADAGSKICKYALFVLDKYNYTLSATLIGVNIAQFGASACVTVAVLKVLNSVLGEGHDKLIAAVSTLVATILILILGEIIPKSYASQHGDSLSAKLSLPVMFFLIVFSPFILLLNGLIFLISKAFGKAEASAVTDDELAYAIEQSVAEGGIEEDKSELLQSAIDFKDSDILDLIVPRVDMVAFDLSDGIDSLLDLIKQTPYSRIPVYEESIDKISGILYVNLLLLELAEKGKQNIDFDACIKEPCIIYPSTSLPDALEILRKQKMQIAVVPDEYGGTLGVVTMEDILEELVGSINDETDTPEEEEVVLADNDTYIIAGDTVLSDAFEEIDAENITPQSDYSTVSGWVIEQLDGFPEEGKSFEYKNFTVTVEKMDELKVDTVKMQRHKTDDEEEK